MWTEFQNYFLEHGAINKNSDFSQNKYFLELGIDYTASTIIVTVAYRVAQNVQTLFDCSHL